MISVANLKTYLRISGSAEDALLAELEAAAVARISRETGRHFGEPSEIAELLHGGGRTIWLREQPLPDTLVVEERSLSDGGWREIDPATYEVTPRRSVIRTAGWPAGVHRIRATYDAGYPEGEEPADIRLAVLQLVTLAYEERIPVSASPYSALPLGVRETIRAYREVLVG